jgi:putative PIN family toxin of toxin-antitoxin system
LSPPVRLVLDTNVVIDWLVFDDPFMNPLRHGVRDGRITVLTHEPAISELARVLGYRQLKLAADRQAGVFARYVEQATPFAMPADFSLKQLLLPGGFPRCRDRDDEHFLALAYHAGADALVSRDNAVFGLKSRAAKFGLTICNVQEMIAALSGAATRTT